MPELPVTSYDETPYPSLSYTQTHPNRLATLATLLGLDPAPVERCRVLEIGCATGGNLLPMAYGLPESEFVGIDNSGRQIELALGQAATLGMRNVRFVEADVVALPDDLGRFDYIVAHGVYSWVPEPVRDALLAACRALLAPQGIAYVSYNAYPGWHLLGMVREMMLYRTRGMEDPAERAAEARAFIRLLAEAVPAEGAYGGFLHSYAEQVLPKLAGDPEGADALLLHDELEAVNNPVYFHDFVEHAAGHGLQYVCEAHLANVMPQRLPPEVVERLRGMAGDPIEFEQYMDFVKNRTFRESLLCHRELSVQRSIGREPVREMSLSSRAVIVSDAPDLTGSGAMEFRGLDGAVFTTNHPLTKSALVELNRQSPQPIPFAELASRAGAAVGMTAEGDLAEHAPLLAANMLQAYGYSEHLVELHVYRPRFVPEPGERPLASPVARSQAATGIRVTNMRHERVTLEEGARRTLMQLDGEHGPDALIERLAQLHHEGGAEPSGEPRPAPGSVDEREQLAQELESILRFLARAALLVG